MLFDLLSQEEQTCDVNLENAGLKVPGTVMNKFNISLLTKRLSIATQWIFEHPHISNLTMGYFASSTGGAVSPKGTVKLFRNEGIDHIEVITSPDDANFGSIEQYYMDFDQVSDEQILDILLRIKK